MTDRATLIVENYVTPMLGVLSNLRVWDEKARLLDANQGLYATNYKNWVNLEEVEVYRNDTFRMETGDFTLDPTAGKITIQDLSQVDKSDFFVTYNFNYYADVTLTQYVNLALHIVNASADPNTHVTAHDIDSAPPYWDAPISLYVYMRALETMVVDSVVWKNFLIFQDGAAAQGLMEAEIQRTRGLFDELRLSVKRTHFIAGPTGTYDYFTTRGLGSFAWGSPRLRGFRSNRLGIGMNTPGV